MDIKDKIEKCVNKISYEQIRKKKYESFKKELEIYRDIDQDEQDFEYIYLKTEYEHQRNKTVLLIVTIAISLLMNI